MTKSKFGQRFKEAFDNATNKEIASKLGVSEAAAQTYTSGRVPPHELLLKTAEVTNCDLHWLLTGDSMKNQISTEHLQPKRVFDEDYLMQLVRQVVREELGAVESDANDVLTNVQPAKVMLARHIGKVDGGEGEIEEKKRKTG